MYESTSEVLYDPDMTRTELKGVEETRKTLTERIEMAEEKGTHTVVTRHGRARAVLVGIEWYREARTARGEPTDL